MRYPISGFSLRTAMDIIDPTVDMFRNEDLFRMMKLSSEQIKEKRLKLTRPILERIHHKVVMMMQDTKLMANELMRKAVNYTLNQWKSLQNILKGRCSGNIEQPL